jgi:hypothetical protein
MSVENFYSVLLFLGAFLAFDLAMAIRGELAEAVKETLMAVARLFRAAVQPQRDNDVLRRRGDVPDITAGGTE